MNEKGFSLLELIVCCGIIAILSLAAAANLSVIHSPLADNTLKLHHHLKLVRSRAIAQTTTIRLVPNTNKTVKAYQGKNCSLATNPYPRYNLNFDTGIYLSDTSWELCFTPRGATNAHVSLSLVNPQGESKMIEVSRGGGTRAG